MDTATSDLNGRRERGEFVAYTFQVLCERADSEKVIQKAIKRAVNTDGCVIAEVLHGPRDLTDGEWCDVDETVNLIADFTAEFPQSHEHG